MVCRSWLHLGHTTATQSICCIEPDPAAEGFGIGFALVHIPPHGALTSEVSSTNCITHLTTPASKGNSICSLQFLSIGSDQAATVSYDWNKNAYTCFPLVLSKSLTSREDITLRLASFSTHNDVMYEMDVIENAISGAKVPRSSSAL